MYANPNYQSDFFFEIIQTGLVEKLSQAVY
jgi:hypothetical protein